MKLEDFFLDFIKGSLLQLTPGSVPLNYLYLNFAWEIKHLSK